MKREQALQIHGFASDVGPTTPPLEILSTSSHDHLEVTREGIYKYLPTKRQSLTLFLIFAIILGICFRNFNFYNSQVFRPIGVATLSPASFISNPVTGFMTSPTPAVIRYSDGLPGPLSYFASTSAGPKTVDVDIHAIAQEINSTFGIEPVQVIDAGEFKSIALPADTDMNSLGNFANLFEDPNPADAQIGGENLIPYLKS